MVRFFRRTYWFWTLLGVAIPFAIGGWTGLLWGGGVRLFFTLHMAFSVNSICHTFGRADFDTGDRSRNEWVLGLSPWARVGTTTTTRSRAPRFHGLRWWQVDCLGLPHPGAGGARSGPRRAPGDAATARSGA